MKNNEAGYSRRRSDGGETVAKSGKGDQRKADVKGGGAQSRNEIIISQPAAISG